MIAREEIRNVLDHPVYDGDGHKIGEAKHVFFDDMTGRPEWVTVKTGLFGTSESFVPIRDASMVEDHIEVPYAKDRIKGAPDVDVDSGGHLSESEEHRLYDYYGIDWNSVLEDDASGPDGGQAGQGDRSGQAAGTGTAAAAGTAAGAAPATRRPDTAAGTAPGREAGTQSGIASGMRPGEADTGYGAGRTGGDAMTSSGDAMTRSEERMHVGVERRETGRARLRKYVVTEDVEQTVSVRKEQAHIEREPITEANRDAALTGPEISEAEHEVILHEERPVVETETVPVERVRLTADEHTEEETVRGQVRKERIEAEGIETEGYGDSPPDRP
ncbi:PRC and DUF2382 domain-containing protein [Streptomyces sp. ID05-47C]|uniref:PRC and DUF2382 domain-containing protein n=1 Tax=Streptomyces sp. ID05-47C TaxID=3028665 RepID=UPI0029B8AAC6|nr:PRC and DUF2382 domain-containing protein [Streptomyces sp. ID05-47C]MDX3571081.1 PRC and DUF2382 domain-containing protein [Streptomyces sp. ID05-47C]